MNCDFELRLLGTVAARALTSGSSSSGGCARSLGCSPHDLAVQISLSLAMILGKENSQNMDGQQGQRSKGKTSDSLEMLDLDDARMIHTDNRLTFSPLHGCWEERRCGGGSTTTRHKGGKSGGFFAISTSSFVPIGLVIETSSTTECVAIQCTGVSTWRLLFTRDAHASSVSEEGSLVDMAVPKSSSHAEASTVSFRLPFSCCKIEAMVLQRSSDFVCIFSVQTFCTTAVRSSSQSTPQSKPGLGPRGSFGR